MAGEDVKLLGVWFSPFVRRVVWALKLKGIGFEYVEEDLTNKSPLLLKYNPVHKKVPVLVHNGNPIVESLVIVEYIDDTWRDNPILPADPYERAMARFWAKFAEEKCMNSMWTAYMSDGDDQAKAIESMEEALKILEQELKGKKFFGGETIGFVDLAMGWAAHWLGAMEEAACIKVVDTHKFATFHAWMENFAAHPVIKDTLPPYDQLVPFFKSFRQLSAASE
ncbi:glutathione transferase GST 23-like [Magnolia sinica]|uniref:glutathione transferase GST 23-like n=1 Tax=Magnolia sinica TaxID=86752 RepID=UPI00265A8479|nr:glutathione transferase GST 23-like [Magnolia sinica]